MPKVTSNKMRQVMKASRASPYSRFSTKPRSKTEVKAQKAKEQKAKKRKAQGKKWESWEKDGCFVVRVFPESEMKELEAKFVNHVTSGPEIKSELPETLTHSYKRKDQEFTKTMPFPLALGGFSAISTPSASMGEFPDFVREQVNAAMDPVIKAQFPDQGLQHLWDRALYRPVGINVSAEKAHVDLPAVNLPTGLRFGGWVNMNSKEDQVICLSPHTFTEDAVGGFKGVDVEGKEFVKILIPPGCALAFPSSGVHKVSASKHTTAVCRFFMGWRSTNDPKTIYDHMKVNVMERLNKGQCPPLPSGQEPAVFAKNHRGLWDGMVWEWVKNALTVPFPDLKAFYEICGKDRALPSLVSLGLEPRPSVNFYQL